MTPATPNNDSPYDLVVAGGGAAGFFAAVACVAAAPGKRVVILEKTAHVLGKVRISGGGRCNVTHACFDPRELVSYYPRGAKQLIGPFHRWGAAETMDWFEQRGVPLKTEPDGRVFPRSDSSQSIIDCLVAAARDAGVGIRTKAEVKAAEPLADGGFVVRLADGTRIETGKFLLTTGGTRARIGAEIARTFGHRTEPATPSLFTFKISDARTDGLQGLAVSDARVTIDQLGLSADGPVLVTHWGLSGPAILRISAWGARELHGADYSFDISIDWTGGLGESAVLARFDAMRDEAPKRQIVNTPLFGLPSRLWARLVEAATGGEKKDLRWPHLTQADRRNLAGEITASTFRVEGKSMNKDEFVTCGGVALEEVDFRTMESRLVPGLHFAGEVLDIDGVTGGFNFQSAWTTGYLAGRAAAGVAT